MWTVPKKKEKKKVDRLFFENGKVDRLNNRKG